MNITHLIGRERAYMLADVAALTGKPVRTVQYDAQVGKLRVVGGPGGRYVKESDLRAYAAKRGIDIDAVLEREAQREAEEAAARELESIKQGLRQLAQLIAPRDRPTWLRTALRESGIEREERQRAKFLEQARAVEQRVEFDALAERMRLAQAYDRGQR